LSAAISAYACQLAVQHATPIDLALPLLAAAVTLCAALSYPAVMVGVPLLIVAEVAVAQEVVRLMLFGAVLAVAVGVAVAVAGYGLRVQEDVAPGRSGPLNSQPATRNLSPLVAVIALVLLRWIPLSEVLVLRELVLLGIAVLIVFVLGRTPFAVCVAVLAVFITPAVPLRTVALPLLVLFLAIAARVFGMGAWRLTWPSAVTVGFLVLFFAWSGVVARSLPFVLRRAAPDPPRALAQSAVGPGESIELDVPEWARSVIVSGANVAHFRRGTILGRIEPGGIAVRIGDAADWGAMRREQVYGSHNPWPREMAGRVRGYGYNAWLDGAGRVALTRRSPTIFVTGDPSLPPNASLQVEGFE
jgi:hypothetical protein